MSLYGKTDTTANQDKAAAALGNGPASVSKTLVYVDDTEAGLDENKSRGITAPGWWAYSTYTDSEGATRHKSEQLVAFTAGESNADESLADDTIAADVASAVTITTQPASATTASGAATFTVATSTTGTPGTLTFQWQRQTSTGTTWINVTNTGIYTGATTNTLALAGATSAITGTKYRVKITSTGGTEEVISNGSATVTFGS